MGWFEGVAKKVRKLFGSDQIDIPGDSKVVQLPYDARMAGSSDFWGGFVSNWLNVDPDLMARFRDYESMDEYPEISSAIDIYADDATQIDSQKNRAIWVTADEPRIEKILDHDLLQVNLRLDDEIWEIARTLVKYGQDYEELLVSSAGVIGLNFLPAPTMRRVEDRWGNIVGFLQDFKLKFAISVEEMNELLAQKNKVNTSTDAEKSDPQDPMYGLSVFEPWEVVHFRLRSKYRRSVYGYSVIETSRWIWRRLTILEDSAVLFRLTKAVERLAFYVDVGDMPASDALAYVNRIRQQYKKRRYVNPSSGQLELRYDALSPDDDFFVPSRSGQESTRIEVLGGPQWQSMDDISYFLNKLFASLKVPKAYLAQEEGVARAVLSSEDVRFARTILRVQRALRAGVAQICRVHLMAVNIDPSTVNFKVWMTIPSAIFELAQLEVYNARADLAARMQEFVSMNWLLQRVFNLSEKDIEVVFKEKAEDAVRASQNMAKGEAAAQELLPAEEPAEGKRFVSVHKLLQDEKSKKAQNSVDSSVLSRKLDEVLQNDLVLRRRLQDLSQLLKDIVRIQATANFTEGKSRQKRS